MAPNRHCLPKKVALRFRTVYLHIDLQRQKNMPNSASPLMTRCARIDDKRDS